jgi:16S rRNA (guanine(966)-N(2))-methyltransferase RsmD
MKTAGTGLRVIGGRYKGRRLNTPDWRGLRPTSDRLRETLFNILSPWIAGAQVVDGYAGTGALGIEALSRGAASVIFIEHDRRAAALIDANVKGCGIEGGYTIHCADVGAALDALPAADAFDLILLDPPYDSDNVSAALDAAARRLSREGVVVLERASRREPADAAGLQRTRDVKSGDSTLTFFRRRDSASGDPDANHDPGRATPGGE